MTKAHTYDVDGRFVVATGSADPDTPSLIGLVSARYRQYRNDQPSWRDGQCWFNALYQVDPKIANKVRGTEVDPYYRDDRINAFVEYLCQLD